MKPAGSVYYRDEYGQLYNVDWNTNNGIVNILTIIRQPYIWGQQSQHKLEDGILYQMGTITTIAQSIKLIDGGYVILAEGQHQEVGYVQVSFSCQTQPKNNFVYDLNNFISCDIDNIVSDGSCWTSVSLSNNVIWGNVNNDGTVSDSVTSGSILQWLDVWA